MGSWVRFMVVKGVGCVDGWVCRWLGVGWYFVMSGQGLTCVCVFYCTCA